MVGFPLPFPFSCCKTFGVWFMRSSFSSNLLNQHVCASLCQEIPMRRSGPTCPWQTWYFWSVKAWLAAPLRALQCKRMKVIRGAAISIDSETERSATGPKSIYIYTHGTTKKKAFTFASDARPSFQSLQRILIQQVLSPLPGSLLLMPSRTGARAYVRAAAVVKKPQTLRWNSGKLVQKGKLKRLKSLERRVQSVRKRRKRRRREKRQRKRRPKSPKRRQKRPSWIVPQRRCFS